MNGFAKFCVGLVVMFIVAIAITLQFAHKLENQNLAIVQSMYGTVEVRKAAGWWIACCPTITEYAKAGMYTLSKNDRDSLSIQFNNKTTADLNCQIGYRIDTADDAKIIALHQQVEGKEDVIWQMVLKRLNTETQSITTKYDPSSVIGGEKFEPMVKEISAAILHHPALLEQGIDINYFAVDGRPIPDDETKNQFEKQKQAALAKQLAIAEKEKLEAEKLKVEANYQMQIAEQRGQAEAQMAKEVQAAEKEKKLAEISAQKQVEVEKLAKEQLLVRMQKEKEAAAIEAEKQRAVAEIQKQTEAANLEKIKLIAQQQIAEAEAKQVCIQKSGAITELQQAELEYGYKREAVKWENIGKGIAQTKLPQMWVAGGNGTSNGAQNPIEMLVNTMTLEKLNSIAAAPIAKPVTK